MTSKFALPALSVLLLVTTLAGCAPAPPATGLASTPDVARQPVRVALNTEITVFFPQHSKEYIVSLIK